MKKILITSTELMMIHFLVPHVNFLLKNGYDVDIVCSEVGGKFAELESCFVRKISIRKVELYRSPIKGRNFHGLWQLRKIINDGNYDLIWTNEPVMGVMTRLAAKKARKNGCKVVYVAHGFHFYNGAPLKNWIFFYPIEKIMSRYADTIVVINKEDYYRAQEKFWMKNVEYIAGIGLDTYKFSDCSVMRNEKRKELGFNEEDFVMLSIGELAERKNQIVAVKALAELQDTSIFYVLVGTGELENQYRSIAENAGLKDNIIFLGYRRDTAELCKMADVFVHPSKREGLGIAPLEAMASGLPLISTYVNGMRDYTEDGVTGYSFTNPDDVEAMKKAVVKMKDNEEYRKLCGKRNIDISRKFDIRKSCQNMKEILDKLLGA